MRYDSPFDGPYGAAGQPALPPGFMEQATQPGRDIQKLLKGIGERFKERREEKRREIKVTKAGRSMIKALGEEVTGISPEEVEEMDSAAIQGWGQAQVERRAEQLAQIQQQAQALKEREVQQAGQQAFTRAGQAERELALRRQDQERPAQQNAAMNQLIQGYLGGRVEGLQRRAEAERTRAAFGQEPGVEQLPPGMPLSGVEQDELERLPRFMQAYRENPGADAGQAMQFLEAQQAAGRPAFRPEIVPMPGGSLAMTTSDRSAIPLANSGGETPLDKARTRLVESQIKLTDAKAKGEQARELRPEQRAMLETELRDVDEKLLSLRRLAQAGETKFEMRDGVVHPTGSWASNERIEEALKTLGNRQLELRSMGIGAGRPGAAAGAGGLFEEFNEFLND